MLIRLKDNIAVGSSNYFPYVDERTAYNHIEKDRSVYADENRSVAEHRVPAFVCPSESLDNFDVKPSSYAGSQHDMEAPIDTTNHGVLFLNSKVAYSDIQDGRAYTMMVGEKISEPDDLGWMSGSRATLRNGGHSPGKKGQWKLADNLGIEGKDNNVEFVNEDGNTRSSRPPHYVGGFGSPHTSVVNFIFADNSVQSVSKLVDMDVFAKLCHRADGELIDWPMNE